MPDTPSSYPWPFPEPNARVFEITKTHIAAIRQLVAVWDIGETGAPALVLPDGDELEDDPLARYVELFLNAAVLPSASGTIPNRLLSGEMPAEERETYLAYIPDTSLRAEFEEKESIPFTADAMDLALWDAAQKWEAGIDPKRPFGTGNVAKDMRAILDPENTLSRGEFTKLKRTRFSRMILMLQLFVQEAQLKPGIYSYSSRLGWQHADERRKTPLHLDEETWTKYLGRPFHKAESSYLYDLQYHVFEATTPPDLRGSYSEVANRLDLIRNYTHEAYSPGPNYLLEKATKGYAHWPETSGDFKHSFFTHVAARCCNALGAFDEAAAWYARAKLTLPDPVIDLNAPVSADESLWVNMTVSRYGSGAISAADFTDLMQQRLSNGSNLRDRVDQICARDEPKSWENYDAAYAQLKLMDLMLAANG